MQITPYEFPEAFMPKAALAVHGKEAGFLVQEKGGVACVQPWPSLGDPSLESLMQACKSGNWQAHPLLKQARRCMEVISSLRQANQPVTFDKGWPALESHYLCRSRDPSELEEARALGFKRVKRKLDEVDEACWSRWRTWWDHATQLGLSIRLDANSRFPFQEILAFLEAMGAKRLERLDFLEDPMPYQEQEWQWNRLFQETGVRLALDRELAQLVPENSDLIGVAALVIKPAYSNWRVWAEHDLPLVFTHNLDHPVGQVWAAVEAAEAQTALGNRVLPSGLEGGGVVWPKCPSTERSPIFDWSWAAEVWRLSGK